VGVMTTGPCTLCGRMTQSTDRDPYRNPGHHTCPIGSADFDGYTLHAPICTLTRLESAVYFAKIRSVVKFVGMFIVALMALVILSRG